VPDYDISRFTGEFDLVGMTEAEKLAFIKANQSTNPQIITATDTVITASDEVYFGDVTDSSKIKKDTVQGILDLVPAPDLSGYWKNDGTATATGDWDIGAYSFNAKNIHYDTSKNNYIGDTATPSLTTGHDNFFVNGAGAKTTTGYDSIGIGNADTLTEMTTANKNIAIGGGALGGVTTNLYSQNVGVGTNAGRYYATSTKTRPARSMYLGHYTQAGSSTPTNENVFGYSAIGKGSNTFVFGQKGTTTAKYYLYGDWINEADNKYIILGAGGDFKIGYDGTNAIINPKAVGSGYLSVLGDIDAGANTIRTTGDIKGVHKAADGTSAVADGTYTVGIGGTTNGTITIKDGIITAVQEAAA
jgi:hypothetical protein